MGLGRQEGFVAGAFVVGGFDENFGEGGAVELSFDVGAVNVHGAASQREQGWVVMVERKGSRALDARGWMRPRLALRSLLGLLSITLAGGMVSLVAPGQAVVFGGAGVQAVSGGPINLVGGGDINAVAPTIHLNG